MKGNLKQRFLAIALCVAMIVTSVNISNLFDNKINAVETTTVDLTGLAAGTETSHTCSNFYETKYDTTNHWNQCSVCNKKYNITTHSYSSYWMMGDSCSPRNKLVHSCSCGRSYTTDNTRTHKQPFMNGNVGIHVMDCRSCLEGQGGYTPEHHYDAYGLLGCISGRSGTCSVCQASIDGTFHQIDQNLIASSNSSYNGTCVGCGQTMLYKDGTKIISSSYNDKNFTYTVTVHTSLYLPNYTILNYGSNFYNQTYGTITSSNYYIHDGYYFTYTISGYFIDNLETNQSIATYITLQDANGVRYQLINYLNTCAEKTAPTINAPTQTNISTSSDGWATNKQLTFTGTENYCGSVKLTLKDSSGNVYLNNVSVNVNNKSWSYLCTPNIEANANGKTFILTATDTLGNSSSKSFVVYKTDKKAPSMTSGTTTTTEWSKTKSYKVIGTDGGSGNLSIAFNNTNGYATANVSGSTYSRDYVLTGDVYGNVTAAIYLKDGVGNTTTKFITVYNLDNTAPTITAVSKTPNHNGKYTASVDLKVTANDINTTLNASGSGVSKYAITTSNTAPTSGWQTSNTFNVTKNGTYYLWSQDLVGNVSAVKTASISEITTSISGTINWVDKSNAYGSRPSSVEISLYKDNTFYKKMTVSSPWTYSFNDLPTGYTYTVSQSTVESLNNPEDTYSSTQSGYNFTNTLGNDNVEEDPTPKNPPEEPKSYQITGTITWDDYKDKFGRRPSNIELILYQNGKEYGRGTYTVDSTSNTFNYAFTNLEKYDSELNLYTYTVEQKFTSKVLTWNETLKDYEEIDAYSTNSSGYNFTNKLVDTKDKPIIEVKPEHVNTLNLKLDFVSTIDWTELKMSKSDVIANISLKQMETVVNGKNVSYTSKYSGMTYSTLLTTTGINISNIPDGKYEINVSNNKFILDSVKLTNASNMSIIKENGKNYLIIDSTNTNNNGTITFTLNVKNHKGYQTSEERNNLYQ